MTWEMEQSFPRTRAGARPEVDRKRMRYDPAARASSGRELHFERRHERVCGGARRCFPEPYPATAIHQKMDVISAQDVLWHVDRSVLDCPEMTPGGKNTASFASGKRHGRNLRSRAKAQPRRNR